MIILNKTAMRVANDSYSTLLYTILYSILKTCKFSNAGGVKYTCMHIMSLTIYHLCANKTEDLINERQVDFVCIF